jgi:flagellar biosynthesis protein FlhB
LAGPDKHSKTEKPTGKRKKEAQKKGQIARSPELLGWTSLLVGTFVLRIVISKGYAFWQEMWVQTAAAISHPDIGTDMKLLATGLKGVLTVVGPFVATMMVLGLVGNFAQVGFKLSAHGMKPSFSKLSPAQGIKRIFSPQGGWEALKSLLKVLVLGLVGWRSLIALSKTLTGQGALSVTADASMVASAALRMARISAIGGLILAIADYSVKRRRMAKGLMMTKHEVKEEAKQADGNQQVKGEIRKRSRRLSRLRMMAAVASADAIVLNPTHVAVAIKYDAGKGAPRVVAKGADRIAARIRAEGEEHQIPLVRDVALARALYVSCELEAEIPLELYEAVARLLAFIFSLRSRGQAFRVDGEAHRPPGPLLVGPLADEAMARTIGRGGRR